VPSYGVYEPVSRHQAAAFSIVGSPTYVGGFPWFSDDDFGEVLAAGEEACGAAFFTDCLFGAFGALTLAFGGALFGLRGFWLCARPGVTAGPILSRGRGPPISATHLKELNLLRFKEESRWGAREAQCATALVTKFDFMCKFSGEKSQWLLLYHFT
jgi:hypothetical protein